MAEREDKDSGRSTEPPVGIQAGNGLYVFDMANINDVPAGPAYSTTHGSLVKGERAMCGLMRIPRGTGAHPHSHPNEQWSYVIEGKLLIDIGGVKTLVPPGFLIYMPPNVVHSATASADADVVFLTFKDTSYGLWGIPAGEQPGGERTGAAGDE
ncbi:MAG: cupin domain-containing protein [Steroidobacteraceae bacterium]